MFIGKTALVTGSTSGIGLGIAHSLASHGANLILSIGKSGRLQCAAQCSWFAEFKHRRRSGRMHRSGAWARPT